MSTRQLVNSDNLAPIIVVAFNRPELFKATLGSLKVNPLATESDLYIYIDGVRENHSEDKEKVDDVIAIANKADGFKKIIVRPSSRNKGLAKSIIGAATEILNVYGKVIVIEDDLYLSPSFLTYMNIMLQEYENDQRVMQITGFGPLIRHSERYDFDHYLTKRAHSWTWGTWKDRWETIDWEVKDFDELASSKKKQNALNKNGSDLYKMLKGWKTGQNNSWYIRFHYAMHKQGRYSVAPLRSLVRNDGFGVNATHCNVYNRYKTDFQEEYKANWNLSSGHEWNEIIDKESTRFWSIPYRIYGKIRTLMEKWI